MVLMQLRFAFFRAAKPPPPPGKKRKKASRVLRLAFYCAALRLVRVLIRLAAYAE